MLNGVRRFAVKLHKDESGPNTVEWVLLIIVALLVLVAIYYFINNVVMKGLEDAESDLDGTGIDYGGG